MIIVACNINTFNFKICVVIFERIFPIACYSIVIIEPLFRVISIILFHLYYFLFVANLIVLILFCRFAMTSSGPELDLEFLTKRKDNVEVPKGIHTSICFCSL
jgi:hypothetical protein